MDRSIARRGALAGAAAVVVFLALLAPSAGATVSPTWKSVPHWYQYTHVTWEKGWRSSPLLVHQNRRWERNHPNATTRERREWHAVLRRRWRSGHYHGGVRWAAGQATWYNGTGATGACGKTLRGLYAASRTLPCGSLVSVRHNGRYVFVRILDRGPFGSARRVLDLSPKAFGMLAPLGTGVIDIHLVQVHPWAKYDLK